MKLFSCLIMGLAVATGVNVLAEEAKEKEAPTSIHDFKMKSLEGTEVDLAKYKGKVLLVVNVASRCGATPQYEQLQALNEKYKDQGLVVMGFPCNQFGAQEPGSATEIREFCTSKYSVTFPMFAKIDVNGDNQSPLYDFLKDTADDHSNIGWNFEKFVVGKDGKVSARFKTRTAPDATEVVKVIEEELSK
ncbi:MAG: glutathione peroxidase [Fuerstiella sp.]